MVAIEEKGAAAVTDPMSLSTSTPFTLPLSMLLLAKSDLIPSSTRLGVLIIVVYGSSLVVANSVCCMVGPLSTIIKGVAVFSFKCRGLNLSRFLDELYDRTLYVQRRL